MRAHYWSIKYWQFYPEITNHQGLLLSNVSSYTVLTILNDTAISRITLNCDNPLTVIHRFP